MASDRCIRERFFSRVDTSVLTWISLMFFIVQGSHDAQSIETALGLDSKFLGRTLRVRSACVSVDHLSAYLNSSYVVCFKHYPVHGSVRPRCKCLVSARYLLNTWGIICLPSLPLTFGRVELRGSLIAQKIGKPRNVTWQTFRSSLWLFKNSYSQKSCF